MAEHCNGLTLSEIDIDQFYRQRLASTPDECRDDVDWLTPHQNDAGEWLTRYGAGISITSASGVTVRDFRVRGCQNGLLLSRVSESRVYDGDASWLSGWGLGMWRCEGVTVSRNAFDGCIRGYSHGVYNRGQDSAGILFFEQNSRNVIAENSITKGGDGIFGFGGNEALASSVPRQGCNDNVFLRNDLSDAAAHGLELTFSFGNIIAENDFERNAICGIWAGYSQSTWVYRNRFVWNGDAGYGLERGGVNIDSGVANVLLDNSFTGDRCGIHLWSQPSKTFQESPWGKANLPEVRHAGWILANRFAIVPLPWHVRAGARVEIDDGHIEMMMSSAPQVESGATVLPLRAEGLPAPPMKTEPPLFGTHRPRGRLAAYRGRQHIVMTEWGPHDPNLGPPPPPPPRRDLAIPWEVRAFPWTADPIKDPEGWQREARAAGVAVWKMDRLELKYGSGGPSDLPKAPESWKKARIAKDHFGTVARANVHLDPGTYRIRALFDDGLRLSVNGDKLLDTWKWHPPSEESATLNVTKAGSHEILVEHFEIDGHAVLRVVVERLP